MLNTNAKLELSYVGKMTNIFMGGTGNSLVYIPLINATRQIILQYLSMHTCSWSYLALYIEQITLLYTPANNLTSLRFGMIGAILFTLYLNKQIMVHDSPLEVQNVFSIIILRLVCDSVIYTDDSIGNDINSHVTHF